MTELVTGYNALRKSLELPAMQVGGYRRETCDDFANGEEALERIHELRPNSGWLLFQSWQGSFTQTLPAIEAGQGRLLAAELVLEGGRCARVEHLPTNGWRMLVLAHDDKAIGLWDRVVHLLRQSDNKALNYRRYWSVDATNGSIQVGAMLASIETVSGRL